jgi:hypothetical protein
MSGARPSSTPTSRSPCSSSPPHRARRASRAATILAERRRPGAFAPDEPATHRTATAGASLEEERRRRPSEAAMTTHDLVASWSTLATRSPPPRRDHRGAGRRDRQHPRQGRALPHQKLRPLLTDGGSIVDLSKRLTRFAVPASPHMALTKGAIEILARHTANALRPAAELCSDRKRTAASSTASVVVTSAETPPSWDCGTLGEWRPHQAGGWWFSCALGLAAELGELSSVEKFGVELHRDQVAVQFEADQTVQTGPEDDAAQQDGRR